MTLSYSPRLIYFSLACFFAMNLLVSLLLRRFCARAIARAGRMPSPRAARFLLALRLSPAALGLLLVAVFCVPSYLWLEPDIASEEASIVGLIAALLGFSIAVIALARALRAVIRSAKFARACERTASLRDARLVIPDGGRLLALVGILRPRLLVSQAVEAALTPAQLALALRHEHVHRASRDNLKRLLILLAPALFLDELERAWKRCAEWAADDLAVVGDRARALELAAVLVRVARIESVTRPPALATSLLDPDEGDAANDLRVRVERLLDPRAPASAPRFSKWRIAASAAAVAVIAMLAPSSLAWVHQALERLMH